MSPENEHIPDRQRRASSYGTSYHDPVLCDVVIRELVTNRSGIYVDATLGGGGHSTALLDVLDAEAHVIGIDQDLDAIEEVTDRFQKHTFSPRFTALQGSFSMIDALLHTIEIQQVDGLLFDLGISSHQIDEAQRGFSFRGAGMLDMRMNQQGSITAHDIVNGWPEDALRRLFKQYGEEPAATRIARKIVERRPLQTTVSLAEVIRSTVPARVADKTLARVFQAIRIEVNQELSALEKALATSVDLLHPGGRIAVISYHSLEDRRVKRFLKYGNLEGKPIRDLYGNLITPWKMVHRKVIQPEAEEIARNPRARSARLRIAERITASTSESIA